MLRRAGDEIRRAAFLALRRLAMGDRFAGVWVPSYMPQSVAGTYAQHGRAAATKAMETLALKLWPKDRDAMRWKCVAVINRLEAERSARGLPVIR